MDQEQLQQQIAEYYAKLSPNLQEVFSSMEWLETLKNIAGKYALNDSQIETLGTETTLVLLGIIHPEEYEEILKNELGVPAELFERLMNDIKTLVLNNIIPDLANTYNANSGSTTEEKQKLDERFGKLPQEIQQAIIDSNYQEVLYQVAENYKLTIEQMGILENLTTDVMLGSVDPENFERTLRKNLNIDEEKANNLVRDLNEKILKNVRKNTMAIKDGHDANSLVNHIDRGETMVLENAGIQIIDKNTDKNIALNAVKPDLSRTEIAAPSPSPTISAPLPSQPMETPPPVPPAVPSPTNASPLEQKLADSFKIPPTNTTHSVENISKPAPVAYPPKADPYRLSPDE